MVVISESIECGLSQSIDLWVDKGIGAIGCGALSRVPTKEKQQCKLIQKTGSGRNRWR